MKAEYICADQPVTLIFRLRQSGGPYIPVCRYPNFTCVNDARPSATYGLAGRQRRKTGSPLDHSCVLTANFSLTSENVALSVYIQTAAW
jgi:hypothetical protein